MLDDAQRKAAIEEGGGIYRGSSSGDVDLKLEPMVYFDDASGAHASTMCLFLGDVTVDAVRDLIRETREAFERCAQTAGR